MRRRVVREEARLVCGIALEVYAEVRVVMERRVGREPQQTLLRPLAQVPAPGRQAGGRQSTALARRNRAPVRTARKLLVVGVVEAEPVLHPTLAAGHAESLGAARPRRRALLCELRAAALGMVLLRDARALLEGAWLELGLELELGLGACAPSTRPQ